jgi:flagellar hook protein FlgE
VPGQEVSGGVAGVPKQIATGSVVFGPAGQLSKVNGAAPANVVVTSPTWADGAAATNFTWNLVDANGVTSLTGYQAASATSSITQNGSAAGTITGISINAEGQIVATFGAGKTVAVAQLAMANFNNPNGLVKLGANAFGESASAGIPNVGSAGTGGRGTLIGSSIEQSNVDVATEFTQMIVAQRGYQANSKSITTADQVLVDTLNLKQ